MKKAMNSLAITLIISLVVVVILIGPGVKNLLAGQNTFYELLPEVFNYTDEDFNTPQLYNVPLKYFASTLSYLPTSEECIFPAKGFNDLFTYYSLDIVDAEKGKRLWLKDSTGQTVDPIIKLPEINLCVSQSPGDVQETNFIRLRKRDPFGPDALRRDYFDVYTSSKEYEVSAKLLEQEPAVYYKKVDGQYNVCLVIGDRNQYQNLPLCKDFSAKQTLNLLNESINNCLSIKQNNCVCGLDLSLSENTLVGIKGNFAGSQIFVTKGDESENKTFDIFFGLDSGNSNRPREVQSSEAFPETENLPFFIDFYPNLNSLSFQTQGWNVLLKSTIYQELYKGTVYVLKQEKFSDYSFIAVKNESGDFNTNFYEQNSINRLLLIPESDINKYSLCSD